MSTNERNHINIGVSDRFSAICIALDKAHAVIDTVFCNYFQCANPDITDIQKIGYEYRRIATMIHITIDYVKEAATAAHTTPE